MHEPSGQPCHPPPPYSAGPSPWLPWLISLGSLLALVGFWAYPLQYAMYEGECGADIGFGLYGMFIATPAWFGAAACVAVWPRRRGVVATSAIAWLLGTVALLPFVLGIFGIDGVETPYTWWLDYAIDNWYGDCSFEDRPPPARS